MVQGYVGLLVAMLLTGLLAYQAAQAERGSRLRQTYGLAAGGFGLILVLNLLWSLGIAVGLLANVLNFAAVAMLIGAVASYVLALLNGEFSAKIRQAQEYTAGERARYDQQRREREQASSSQPELPAGDDKAGP
jgi:hypothetical protein